MAAALSPAQVDLLNVVVGAQQPETQRAAEAALQKYASSYAGYALLLLSLLQPQLASTVGADNQLFVAVALKLYVKKHWSEAYDTFEPPVIPDGEKAQLHATLLHLLATDSTKVRRQISAIITDIAESDFPERWTNLLPDVATILRQAASAAAQQGTVGTETPAQSNLLNGALNALTEFCEQMEDHQLAQAVPDLFPTLIGLAQKKFALIMQVQTATPAPQLTPQQEQAVRDAIQFCIYVLRVFQSCCSSILTMNELNNSSTKGKKSELNKLLNEFLLPSLPGWFAFMSAILQMPQQDSVFEFARRFPLSWGLRLESVKTLINIGEKFETNILAQGLEGAKVYEGIMNLLLDTMSNLYPMYERRVLHARLDEDEDTADGAEEAEPEDDDAFDEDGNAITMTIFLYECFQYFKHILQMRPPKKASAKKAAKAGKVVSPVADKKQAAWAHLVSLFNGTSGAAFLPRLLQLSLQYGQLSSREIAASLGKMEDFLTFQEDDHMVGATINVRNGVRDLLTDCILWNESSGEEDGLMSDMAELRAMGLADMGGMEGAGVGTVMVDRALVVHTLCPLLTNLLQHASTLRAQQHKHWWKGRELATLIVAHIVQDILAASQAAGSPPKKAKKGAPAPLGPPAFNLQSFVTDILIPDLSVTGGNPPLLRTQALTSTARFAPVFEKAKEANLVLVALEAIVANMAPQDDSSETLVVRIAAVNAFGSLCATIDQKLLMHNNLLPTALTNICQLMHAAATPDAEGDLIVDETALIKVLETLMFAINVDKATTIAAEKTLTPLLLSAWSANATSPAISDGVTDIFSRLLSLTPETCISVQVQVLPVLQQILLQNQSQVAVSGTTGAALDLLKSVLLSVEKHTRDLKAAAGDNSASGSSAASHFLHPLLFSTLLPLTLALVRTTDDHDLIDYGTTVLTAFLRIDAAQVANISVPIVPPGAPAGTPPQPMAGLQVLCLIIAQFLDPALDDRVAHNVGGLITQVVFSLGDKLGEQNIKELIKSVVARLHASHFPPLNESLLLVFARLIHSSGVPSVLGFLSSLGRITVQEKSLVQIKRNETDKYTSSFKTELKPVEVEALPYLLSKWIEAQKEVNGKYPSKVLFLALEKVMHYLFSNAPGVDALRNIECKGYVVAPPTTTKRVTRSATARSGNSSSHEPTYTKIPLSAKILSLFINEWGPWHEARLHELKRQAKREKRLAGGDDDDEDDEFDEDEDDEFLDEDDYSDDGGEDAWIQKMQGKMAAGSGKSPFAAASDFPDLDNAQSLKGHPKLMTLSDMLNHHAGDLDEMDDELEPERFPESLTDPLNAIELGPFLQKFLQDFAQANGGAAIQDTARWLDEKDQHLLKEAIAAK